MDSRLGDVYSAFCKVFELETEGTYWLRERIPGEDSALTKSDLVFGIVYARASATGFLAELCEIPCDCNGQLTAKVIFNVMRPNETNAASSSQKSQVGLDADQSELQQYFPNPSAGHTKVNFSVKESSYSILKVHDLLGQEVTTLFDAHAEEDYNGPRK